MAGGAEVGVIPSVAGLMTMLRDCEIVCGVAELSVAWTEMANVPLADGVPEIVPPVAVSPAGTPAMLKV